MKFLYIIALVLLSGPALADEVNDFCNMTKANAESQSTILRNPTAFTGLGDPQTREKLIATGVKIDVSSVRQAYITDHIADAQCTAYGLNKQLNDTATQFQNKVTLNQLNAEIPLLEEALDKAEAAVQLEREWMKSEYGTIGDLSTAVGERDTILATLTVAREQKAAIVDLPVIYTTVGLKNVVEESVMAQAKVASLTADFSTARSWNVSISAGLQNNIERGGKTGFAAINAEWNFGAIKSRNRSNSVADLTAKYLESQHDSVQNSYLRLIKTIDDLSKSEQAMYNSLLQQKESLVDLLDVTKGVDSVAGRRATIGLNVQLLFVEAQLAASNSKLNDLNMFKTGDK